MPPRYWFPYATAAWAPIRISGQLSAVPPSSLMIPTFTGAPLAVCLPPAGVSSAASARVVAGVVVAEVPPPVDCELQAVRASSIPRGSTSPRQCRMGSSSRGCHDGRSRLMASFRLRRN